MICGMNRVETLIFHCDLPDEEEIQLVYVASIGTNSDLINLFGRLRFWKSGCDT